MSHPSQDKDTPPLSSANEVVMTSMIHHHDVLLGDGPGSSTPFMKHPGNIHLQNLIQKHNEEYWNASKKNKQAIARAILQVMITKQPPGRFLKQINEHRWREMGHELFLERIKNRLRRKDMSHPSQDKDTPPLSSANEVVMTSMIHHHDVLLGDRPGSSTPFMKHPGNIHLRSLIKKHNEEYWNASKKNKQAIARAILQVMITKEPPGRFLKQINEHQWRDMGHKLFLERIKNRLRRKDTPPLSSANEVVMTTMIHHHDVLLGKGTGSSTPFMKHPGNAHLHNLIKKHNEEYWNASNKEDRAAVLRAILQVVITKQPPGRFLKQINEHQWRNISHENALRSLLDKMHGIIKKKKKISQDPSESMLVNETPPQIDQIMPATNVSVSPPVHTSCLSSVQPESIQQPKQQCNEMIIEIADSDDDDGIEPEKRVPQPTCSMATTEPITEQHIIDQTNLPTTRHASPALLASPRTYTTFASCQHPAAQPPHPILPSTLFSAGDENIAASFHPTSSVDGGGRKVMFLPSKEIRAAASKMFESVLAHARSEIKMILSAYNGDHSDEDAFARGTKLKNLVRHLREERKSNRHIDCILNVTDGGKDLIFDPIVNSKDCLELIMNYMMW